MYDSIYENSSRTPGLPRSDGNQLARVYPVQANQNYLTNEDTLYPELPRPSKLPSIHSPSSNAISSQSSSRLPPISMKALQKNSNSKRLTGKSVCLMAGIVLTVLIVLGVIGAIVAVVLTLNKSGPATTTTEASTLGSFSNCSSGYVGSDCDIECGVVPASSNYLKIVGGQTAVAHSWPSIVFVYFSYRARVLINGVFYTISQNSFCGGTLLDRSTVLTAAHCIVSSISYTHPTTGVSTPYTVVTNSFFPTVGSMYSVHLGVHDRTDLSSTGAVTASVSAVYSHESYDDVNVLNDIAVLKLSSKVTLSSLIQPACLPDQKSNSYPVPDRASYAAGWGTLSSGGSAPSKLNDVQLTIYSSSRCTNVDAGSTKNFDSQICAGDLTGNKDTCQGDSGGPLYITDTVAANTKVVAAGITSYGVGCANAGLPAIYTRVSYYLDWIQAKMD